MTLLVLGSTHLSKDMSHLEYFKFGTPFAMLSLVDSIRHHHFVKGACIDSFDSIATEDAMSDESIHFVCTFLLKQFCSSSDGVACVREIIDENSCLSSNITNQHHCCVLSIGDSGRSPLLMNECKLDAQRISDSSSSFGASSIRTDHDTASVVGNVVLDVLLQERSTVQIVDGNVKETLILRVMEIHCDDMICSSTGQEVCYKGSCLSYPLSIAGSGLECVLGIFILVRKIVTDNPVGGSC